ncbi:NAD(P)/FAD-dependent oxidoreductase [Halopenitus persicus]|uniref:Sarcosine oxidase subunit beta n=1 Tax=Halopenitus persicus TaxID=1048396 RepID=A0A1H3L2H6_9EURY|nr:FAD-binding oxidoreductase [Halopenitus persicus]SDY58085.1 sarcosine oxidase subunit beta [Halopenitus persicus]
MTGTDETTFAVVGGGIVGASVAYHLSERTDEPVTVYERGDPGGETTRKSTAMIGVSGPEPLHELRTYGIRLYNDLLADPTAAPRYQSAGRLRVTTDPDVAAGFAQLADAAAGRADRDAPESTPIEGIDAATLEHGTAAFVPGEEIRGRLLVPPVNAEELEGALYRPEYGHISGDRDRLGAGELARELLERAKRNGVTVESRTEVTEIRTAAGRVVGIETRPTGRADPDANPDPGVNADSDPGANSSAEPNATVVEARNVICAAGPWNPELAATAGVEVPVEHVRSPVFALDLDRPLPYTLPMIKSHESSVGIHPKRRDRILVTYTPRRDGDGEPAEKRRDPSAVPNTPRESERRTALRWAERLVPRLADATLADEWVGVGTKTPDGAPIVGRTAVEGLSLAVTGAGIQLAPAVGDVLARRLVDGETTPHNDALAPSRFADGPDR